MRRKWCSIREKEREREMRERDVEKKQRSKIVKLQVKEEKKNIKKQN